jgi:hypothetical protein
MTHDDQRVGWYVHLGRLSAATEGAAETASGLSAKVGRVQTDCVSAASGHQGMGIASSLTACHARFADHFDGHVTEIHRIRDHLATSHTSYTLVDQQSEDSTRNPTLNPMIQEI